MATSGAAELLSAERRDKSPRHETSRSHLPTDRAATAPSFRNRVAPAPATPRSCGALRPPYVSDRKSTRLNSSHVKISYAVFCLKKKKKNNYSHKLNKKKQTNTTSPT